jgi:hypothetical protein
MYLVHPLRIPTADQYWAAFALEFHYTDPAYDLINVQIVVFRGDPFGDKRPLFRAEWHCSEADLAASHAQPHWHIYAINEPRTTEIFGERSAAQFTGLDIRGARDVVDFHFAMSAAWDAKGVDAHRAPIADSATLTRWFEGCLQYIRSELPLLS